MLHDSELDFDTEVLELGLKDTVERVGEKLGEIDFVVEELTLKLTAPETEVL